MTTTEYGLFNQPVDRTIDNIPKQDQWLYVEPFLVINNRKDAEFTAASLNAQRNKMREHPHPLGIVIVKERTLTKSEWKQPS